MNFFKYRALVKEHPAVVLTDLDARCRRYASGRQLLRDAWAGKPGLEKGNTILHGPSDPREALIAWNMQGMDPETAGMETMQLPTPDQLPEKMKQNGTWNTHPRLLATREDFARIREQLEWEPSRTWFASLKSAGERLLLTPFVEWFDVPKGAVRDHYLWYCREFYSRMEILGMLYHLTGDTRYAQRGKAELLNFASYPSYFPQHFLDVAEACFGLAIGYDWLYDFLSPAEREFLFHAAKEKCFLPAFDSMRTADGWAGAMHNWNQVCNGGIAVGALAMMEQDPELCCQLVCFALRNIPRSLADLGPDGCFPEGPTYWNFGTTYATNLMASLNTVFGTDFGLSGVAGFAESASYIHYCTAPSGEIASYADTNDDSKNGFRVRMPQTLWMADRFGENAFTRNVLSVYPYHTSGQADIRELLWYHPEHCKAEDYPLDMVYDGRESMAFFRQSWEDADSTYVFFKGGNNQTNHGCLDIGQFLLDRFQIRWACDLKCENYAVPGYWDRLETRWHYYRKRAEGHNTLLINPGKDPDQDIFAACSIDTFGTSTEAGFAVCDLTEAYRLLGAQSVRRGCLLFDKRTKLLVQDEIQCTQESTVWWRMHTAVPNITLDGKRAILKEGSHFLTVTIQSPDAVFTLSPAEPIPGSFAAPENSPNPGISVLSIHLDHVKCTTLRVVFTFDGEDTLPEEMALDDFSKYIKGDML